MLQIQSLNNSTLIIFFHIQSFKNRQSRRPSFTESIVSALNRFDFLDEDDTSPTTALPTPPPPHDYESPACYILPKQWQRVHRALFHHLCVVFDLADLIEKQLGPLDSLQNKSRGLISEHMSDIEKLMSLMSNPDDILLANSEYIYIFIYIY